MIDTGFHIDSLIEDCEHAANKLAARPGTATTGNIAELYLAIARLSRIVRAAEARNRPDAQG